METKAYLKIENVCFSYSKNKTINNISLAVEEGSFTTLLGPSGCGKTTLLKLLSVFLTPQEGNIFINNINQNELETSQREIGIVFQDYALFPHFTVKENLLYGLKIKNKKEKVPSKEFYKNAESLIQQSARLLGLVGLLDRFPHELSGGQQQRVALGRALILKPKILLMDEPLSSLDAKLRNQVRDELKEIQKDFGITTIYVTHDQEEALYLSDKIAVMNHGQIRQIGSPEEIYFKPKNKFVADFVGKANFIEDETSCFIVRPEWINLEKTDSKNSENKIISKTFLGSTIRYKIGTNKTINGILIVDKSSNDSEVFNLGDFVKIDFLQKWKTEP